MITRKQLELLEIHTNSLYAVQRVNDKTVTGSGFIDRAVIPVPLAHVRVLARAQHALAIRSLPQSTLKLRLALSISFHDSVLILMSFFLIFAL